MRWGSTLTGKQSPFYELVRVLLPGEYHAVWNNSGGARVNGPANLMVLAPTYHRMYDMGTLRLEPDFGAQMYPVRFVHPQPRLRHTTAVDAYSCAELRDGDLAGSVASVRGSSTSYSHE
jgi:hypothetical protein